MELIKIYQGNVIDSEELRTFLGIKTRANDWLKRIFDYGFYEGKDYFYSDVSKSTGGRPKQECFFTINMAKEVCMLARTSRGQEARRYFIKCEEQLKQLAADKRFSAFMKLESSKEKFKNTLLERGLSEQNYIEIDTAGKKVFMNGKVVDDELLQTVLLTARDLATQITNFHTHSNDLRDTESIKTSNEENHFEVRGALLNKGIVPEDLPQQKDINDIKKLEE
ncbi:antA/AntB antirepressor family protein [Chondrinema litorale]|uniref:antA/AntB antirepressor family protein n=1 Tax=Chondrinema litorale TaxID=2994555 RepID=UPI002542AECE|nr:antA/AntB antirepressor family protein [Chondrinema litorale]UZR99005.1 antA/AntB antirepressor family protein [Chondrinema litorale]